MTTLWWVRHGPTHRREMIGWADPPADLSDSAALARLSAFLPPAAPIVSSDLTRARATADALQAGRPRLPDEPALRELNFGAWEERRAAEIESAFPDLYRRFLDGHAAARPPGGESFDDLAARVDAAADRIAAHGDEVIVVAHFGAILTQVRRALGCTARQAYAHRVETLSVTRLDHGPAGWSLGLLNHRP